MNNNTLLLVKPGNTVRITPKSNVPNAIREFKVDIITNIGFIYGSSITCDGYTMPFSWIDDLEIVK